MSSRKLVAALAVRNQGSRLYGKPLQNLDIDTGYTILDNIIGCLQSIEAIDEIVLGISEGTDNLVFQDYARRKGLRHIVGDQKDVLGRLVQCADLTDATDVFRVTSESPFLCFEYVARAWEQFLQQKRDAYFFDRVVDGTGFEIISADALRKSHAEGDDRHRSELCTLYIRENRDKFSILIGEPDERLQRKDLRLTVDYPEDLIVCRFAYQKLKARAPRISVHDIIALLDENPFYRELIGPYTESGYKSMYL